MSHTANGRRVVTISLIFFVVANLIWLGMPFGMAILWSLVDPAHPWSYPISSRRCCRSAAGCWYGKRLRFPRRCSTATPLRLR